MPPKKTPKLSAATKKSQKQVKNVEKEIVTTRPTGTPPPPIKKEKLEKEDKPSSSSTSTSNGESKMTLCTVPIVGMRPQTRERRPGRPPSGKRLAMSRENMPGKLRSSFRRSLDPCENSNDSGLGFDHHNSDPHHILTMSERLTWTGERAEAKRPRMDIKLEQEDVNDGYSFPDSVYTCKENQALIRTAPSGTVPSLSISTNQASSAGRAVPRCIPLSNRQSSSSPVPLTTQLSCTSRYMDVSLTIVKQPEQQHRARYQTEGSRGAVKDREGNGFPIVQLSGYYKPAALQVFIGTDMGKVAPHMFYQACKVSGKNSTPCMEKKLEGTCVIELQLEPSKDMSATCDCVGILKERNVDVEHRFPDQLGNRSKKKSTRCRMIFRTTITLDDGSQETLQVCSQPIVCTQPPGIPEICKKSLTSCPASGGLELFVLGKNFLKDTKVFFQQTDEGRVRWEQGVSPDKEYLQQTHFVCVVPPYHRTDITEPVSVRLCVVSSGKTSEPHQFVYTPVNGVIPSVHMEQAPPPPPQAPFFNKMLWQSPVSKRDQDLGMMPPPDTSMVPLSTRRSSISIPSTSEAHSPPLHTLKQEYIDENSQNSVMDPLELPQGRFRHISESSLDVHHGDSNISMINENSIDMIRRNRLSVELMNPNINDNSNLSLANENSMEMQMVRRNSLSRHENSNLSSMTNDNSMDMMVRRNSLSRPTSSMCENSLMNDDSSCSTAPLHCSNSVVTDRLVLSQSLMQHQNLLSTVSQQGGEISNASVEDLKVMDLRMKMPMATVADLVNTKAPSMATLQCFGVTESSNEPLPTQSAQSVESFLNRIETKTIDSTHLHKMSVAESNSVFLSTQRPYLSSTTTQNDVIDIVAKSEAAAIPEQTSTNTMAPSNIPSTISPVLENSIAMPINTERLDAFVNSTVESHIGSPTNTTAVVQKELLSTPKNTPDVIITTQDVMLNTQLVPQQITRMPSPINEAVPPQQLSPNISPEVILNTQISPSLMCRTTTALPQDSLLPSTLPPGDGGPLIRQNTSPGLLSVTSPPHIPALRSPIMQNNPLIVTEPEKAVLLEAAADLMITQQKLSQMETVLPKTIENKMTMHDLISIASRTASNEVLTNELSSTSNGGYNNNNNNQQGAFTTSVSTPKTIQSDVVIPETVKEINGNAVITQGDNNKKNEDRMIPQSFTSLTENELINFINPSCFDQV